MRAPTYTPREMQAFQAADRVIARVFLNGAWKEQQFLPGPGQTVRNKLAEVQHALRHHIDPNSGIVLYIGGPVNGEVMRAAVRRDSIPDELRR